MTLLYYSARFGVDSDSVNSHYGVAAEIDSMWGAGTVFQKRFLKTDGELIRWSATTPQAASCGFATVRGRK